MFVTQAVGSVADQIEQSFATRFDMCAVLNIIGRPIPFSRLIVPLVKQCVEGVEYQRFIFLLCRLIHNNFLIFFVTALLEAKSILERLSANRTQYLNRIASNGTKSSFTAESRSAEMGTLMSGFATDPLSTSYEMLARYVTNPHCIELIANRDWQLLTCDKPYFLKPDSGVVLTDRLDNDDCLILYPLSPVSCFVATGNGGSFSITSVQTERVFALNNDILRWSDDSVACTTQFWSDEESLLRDAAKQNLAGGKFCPPTSGRFFSVDGVECEGKIRATLLA